MWLIIFILPGFIIFQFNCGEKIALYANEGRLSLLFLLSYWKLYYKHLFLFELFIDFFFCNEVKLIWTVTWPKNSSSF